MSQYTAPRTASSLLLLPARHRARALVLGVRGGRVGRRLRRLLAGALRCEEAVVAESEALVACESRPQAVVVDGEWEFHYRSRRVACLTRDSYVRAAVRLIRGS